ncbi:Nonaspanin (TM9SF) [Trinorchestia longiramus]|nr:Nonaspanin (TM9SF) [Trinorchestia longiramus]
MVRLPLQSCRDSATSAKQVNGSAAYKNGEKIEVYVNKVGPYFNPHETYHYYSMPVCRPKIIEHKGLTLGEVLDGDRMAKSIYNVNFGVEVTDEVLCRLTLSDAEVMQLADAIEENYYYEFVVDDIPVREFLGHVEETGFVPHSHKIFLWTHQQFTIYHNKDKIIMVNLTRNHNPLELSPLEAPLSIKPTYSVSWIPTKTEFSDRTRLLQDNTFFPRSFEIHWLSIINSAVLVFLLIGFVGVIMMRILRRDFARYNSLEDESSEDLDTEYGWKIIHTDVFRLPPRLTLFCSILGVGCQFLFILLGILTLALLGLFDVHRHGSMNAAGVILYALTSFVAGLVAATFYRKMDGQKWVTNINLTTVLFTGPLFLIWAVQNTVAWAYSSTQALPMSTVLLLLLLWLLVGYPLTVLGGVLGHRHSQVFQFPCRSKNFPREIPQIPWYKAAPAHCFIGGFLPFSAISVELYYIFSTLWGRETYTLYGILALVLLLVLSVTACVSVALTYFLLASEDYHWWWRSIYTAGSTGLFVLMYSVFYYTYKSNMSGLLQTVEFVGCLVDYHQLGRLVSESACERKDPGSNPDADMVDAARNTAWDLGKQPNNYRSNYPTQEWARRIQSLSRRTPIAVPQNTNRCPAESNRFPQNPIAVPQNTNRCPAERQSLSRRTPIAFRRTPIAVLQNINRCPAEHQSLSAEARSLNG